MCGDDEKRRMIQVRWVNQFLRITLQHYILMDAIVIIAFVVIPEEILEDKFHITLTSIHRYLFSLLLCLWLCLKRVYLIAATKRAM
jgi:hypothetical protein